MAGDEDKKKKKKKKVADEAPPPEPEPVKEAPPPPPPADDEGEDDWLSGANDPEPVAASGDADEDAPPADGEALAEGEALGEGEVPLEEGELPPQPKKKPKFFVHWDRRKAKFYDYNFDYGTNYYSSMVGYVDQKNTGSAIVPRRMAFAERGMYSSLERSRNPDMRTQSLLNDVRSSIRNFETSQRIYAYGTNRNKY